VTGCDWRSVPTTALDVTIQKQILELIDGPSGYGPYSCTGHG
jgi:hypothetical protein